MSDSSGTSFGINATHNNACRVAYTLNNSQPVISTIIGDQPLFYMDYDCAYEDETDFDTAQIDLLRGEIEKLQNDIVSLDKFSEQFVSAPDANIESLLANKENICETVRFSAPDISDITAILDQSRLGAAYIELAKTYNIEIKLSGQIADATYDRNAGMIFINKNLELVDQVLLCARELRRHAQHRNGALINPLMFHPDHAVLVNRMQNADLTVNIIRIAWELQLSNYKHAWDRIENSAMSDLGHAFAREAFIDFRTINNGQAASAVLESWFLSERCTAVDKYLVQQMLVDYHGHAFDLDEAQSSITPALIAALGEMPFGKNYLSAHVYTLMEDPIFTDVRDRSNANFLWFIKFERSFRETEQELQINPEHTADDVRSSASIQGNQGQNYDATQENSSAQSTDGEVISLFADQALTSKHEKRTKLLESNTQNQHTGADIVYLRQWSGDNAKG